ncbi:MAG: radical SAM protein [Pirellulales bacterium]|nr:radical SAM protein [Pirellulales bacterium]
MGLTRGILTFSAGESLAFVTLQVADDGTYEGDESFTVSLSGPSGGTFIDGSGVAGSRIRASDVAISTANATFSLINGAAGYTEGSDGTASATNAVFTVHRTGNTAAQTLNYIIDGYPGVNYARPDAGDFLPGEFGVTRGLTFAAGQSVATITVRVAQDTTYYGMDTDGRPRLAELLGRLEAVPGIEWIRLMYLYPMHFTDELVDRIASSDRILPYLDLPLQHVNERVLKRMARRVTRAETEHLLDRLRHQIPGLVLRTTMITGFPGESEEQFQEMLDFVVRRRFERLGVFAYSFEPDTPSAKLDGQIPEQVRQERRNRILAAQQEIAFAWNRAQVGRPWEVLIDRDIPGEENAFVGRTYADAPEIDGVVYVTGENLSPGQIVPCEVVDARDYDLIAAATGAPR